MLFLLPAPVIAICAGSGPFQPFLQATLCSPLTLNPRKIASSVALLWPFKAPHGPLLASHGPSAPVDVFILYPPPTSRPDVRL